jgi:hypothetical protein
MLPPADPADADRFTDAQRAGLDIRRDDDDRTLAAVHQLETALAAAAPGREVAWRDQVLAALGVLRCALATEQANAEQPDSLLSDIARTQPRLRTPVRGLRRQYRHLVDAITALHDELSGSDERLADYADIRERLAWLLTALRHQQARESDLIYEAYHEAFDASSNGEGL